MPAHTYNIDQYGIGGPLTQSAKSCWNAAGTTTVLIGPTDYTAGVGAAGKYVVTSNGCLWRCLGQGTTAVGAGGDIWDDTGWHIGAGPGTNYYFTVQSALVSGYSGGFYHGSYYTLGNLPDVSFDHDSNLDTMGMPTQNDTQTLVFDVDGVVTTIKLNGVFFETTAATLDGNMSVLQALLSGSQFTGNGCCFWWDVQKSDGNPKPWIVTVKNLNFKKTERNTASINYSMTLIRRKLGPA